MKIIKGYNDKIMIMMTMKMIVWIKIILELSIQYKDLKEGETIISSIVTKKKSRTRAVGGGAQTTYCTSS